MLDEWERKGGDPKEFRLFASAANGLEMDVANAGTAAVVLRNWLLSPQGGHPLGWQHHPLPGDPVRLVDAVDVSQLAHRPGDRPAGVSGIVDSMNMLSTTIRTFDNKLMIVPNGKIGGDTITNATASATRRVDLTFGVGYDDDMDAAQAILERIVRDHPLVLKDPEPVIKLNELADSSIHFIVRPWMKTVDYWAVYWDVTAAVKREFDKAGISIPYPQRDVHLRQASSPGTA